MGCSSTVEADGSEGGSFLLSSLFSDLLFCFLLLLLRLIESFSIGSSKLVVSAFRTSLLLLTSSISLSKFPLLNSFTSLDFRCCDSSSKAIRLASLSPHLVLAASGRPKTLIGLSAFDLLLILSSQLTKEGKKDPTPKQGTD
nr:hypothetical protein Q903MT_gene2969 [Picea sitchensis]